MQRVYAINIGMLPNKRRHPIKRRMCVKALLNTPGLLDFWETKEHGTLLIFGTMPHAEKARDAMRESGNWVGDEIYLVIQDVENRAYYIKDIVNK